MTHQGLEDVWKGPVECGVWFGEDSVVVNVVVHHECEAAGVPHRNEQVNDTVEIGELPKEEIQCTRY